MQKMVLIVDIVERPTDPETLPTQMAHALEPLGLELPFVYQLQEGCLTELLEHLERDSVSPDGLDDRPDAPVIDLNDRRK